MEASFSLGVRSTLGMRPEGDSSSAHCRESVEGSHAYPEKGKE